MDGLFGIVRLAEGPLDPAMVAAQGGATAGQGPLVRTERAAIFAFGWAQGVHDHELAVAGSAHLVNRAELSAECGVANPLGIAAALYRTSGPEGLARLDGQFCLALFDAAAQRLVLAVDRFVTRLIYYSETKDGLVFGSSLSRVAASGDRAIDHQAMLEYLLHEVIPAPRTAYLHVRKLPAGHLLVADQKGLRVAPYWDMTYARDNDGDAKQWAVALRGELEGAVRRYVEAEESLDHVGAFLSGGTDSSTVAGMIAAITHRPPKTFSIGYGEQQYSELSYARIAAQWFGTEQHEWALSAAEAFDALPAIVAYYEEPFGNASVLPTYRCARLAREHGVTILFAGDGGDELFGGNERYATYKTFDLYQRLPRTVRRGLTDPLLLALPDTLPVVGRVPRYVRRSNIPNPRRMFSYNLLLSEPLERLLTPEFLATVRPDELLETAEGHFRRPAAGTAELDRLLYLDLKMTIADNDLRKVSGMAELAGVSVPYPLLDTRLAEFSGRIPPDLKLRGFEKRYVFKQALADFLPPEVLKKTKHGFGAPIAVWMKSDAAWKHFVGDLLHDPRTRQRGYLRAEVLDTMWRQLQIEEASYYGDCLWPLLMLELWHRERGGRNVTEGNGWKWMVTGLETEVTAGDRW